ncbi:hypothetical protein AAFP35_05475 [Gordonia sp. CPCC 206044]|uniref:8-oxoguanine DNA glycosylase OGG fold protein n=1 Tax=Gordonia sp. CPCC 206044 TaxID=3140793 RepID=UPI003AF3CBF5
MRPKTMNPTDIAIPRVLSDWLAAGDRTAELCADAVDVDRRWWTAALSDRGFPDVLDVDTISRSELFRLGAEATRSSEGAIALLWNTIAFCQGRRTADTKRRIGAVADDRERIGRLLQQAALQSRDDPAAAFALLKPDRGGTAIDRMGPAGFTWFLYFAGAGDPHHRSQVLDGTVARTLRRAGWRALRRTSWVAEEYAQYSELVSRWRTEAGIERNDVIVRGLYSVAPSADVDYPWQAWERETWRSDDWVTGPLSADDLRSTYHWLALVADAYPMSTAAHDFSRIGPKIERVLGSRLGEGPRLRSMDERVHGSRSHSGGFGHADPAGAFGQW